MAKLDKLIDTMFLIREEIRALEAQKKEKEQKLKKLKLEYQAACAAAGTDYARGKLASASITEQIVPIVEDWAAVHEYIMENNALYLLHRRLSAGPWKELLDMGDTVPGVEPFTKRDVSLRRLGNKDD